MIDLDPRRQVRPTAGDRDRIIAFLERKAASLRTAGDNHVAMHFEVVAHDIAQGMHE